MFAGREGRLSLPALAFQVQQIPDKNRLAFEEIEAPTAEATPLGCQHSLASAFGDIHLGGDGVRGSDQAWRIAHGDAGQFAGIGELGPARCHAGTRRDHAHGEGVIQRENLVFVGLLNKELLHLL